MHKNRIRPAMFIALIAAAVCAATAQKLESPPYVTDGLVIVERAENLRTATSQNVVAVEGGKALGLAPGTTTGSTAAARVTNFEFNEMVPSWNVVCTTGTGMRLWMSTEEKPGERDWFVAAQWGTPQPPEVAPRKQRTRHGEYMSDTLILRRPSRFVHWRVDFSRDRADIATPKLSLLAASYTNTLGNKKVYEQFGDKRPTALAPSGKKLELSIPFKAQIVNDQSWVGRICSPVSVATAVGKFGLPLTVNEASRLAYDPTEDIFGNWNRSVAMGSQVGARGYITRFRNFAQVRDALAKGHVICPSIKFAYGTVKLNEVPPMYALRGTEGHLIVITGIDKDGKIITHDSASRRLGTSCRWSQDALGTAWFPAKGGVAYVFTGKR